MRGAGKGGLGLAIEGPVEAQMNCQDNRDGTCNVQYQPTKAGDYDIAVKFADKDIPGTIDFLFCFSYYATLYKRLTKKFYDLIILFNLHLKNIFRCCVWRYS